MDRYLKNKNLISQEEQNILRKKKVVVLGCGGLGGYVIEMLVRLGVGKLILTDYDTFDESNLNRQLISEEKNLGRSKVKETVKRISRINSRISVVGVEREITEMNLDQIIKGADLVIDALDSIPLKISVEKVCSKEDISMVHGAIGGWIGQVAVVRPGDFLLKTLYGDIKKGIEEEMGNPSFTPAAIASIQVSEALKLLLGRGTPLKGEVLYIDLENNDFSKIQMIDNSH